MVEQREPRRSATPLTPASPVRNIVPSSLVQVGIMTKYELVNYFRSRRFYVLLIIAFIISTLLTGLVGYYRPSSFISTPLDFYSSWWGSLINLVIVLSAIFFGGDSISGEFQNKTGYFLVGNPIRRSAIYIGKWIAAFIASALVLGAFAALAVANGLYYFGTNIPLQFGESLLFSILYLVSVLAFTFFFSALFKTSSISILLTAILFLFVFNLLQNLVSGLVQVEPWFLITYGAQIIGNVLTDPYPEHVRTQLSNFGPPGSRTTITSYNVTIPEGIAILLAYFAVTAVLGLLIFQRKEFT